MIPRRLKEATWAETKPFRVDVGETANGTADIRWILEGKDYPRLWWEKEAK